MGAGGSTNMGQDKDSKKRPAQTHHKSLKKKRKETDAATKELESLLFGVEDDEQSEPLQDQGATAESEPRGQKAAWQDEDDDEVEVDIDSKNRTRKLRQQKEEDSVIKGVDYVARLRTLRSSHARGSDDWAKPDDEDDAELKKFARRKGSLQADAAHSSTKTLGANTLHVKRMKDANSQAISKSVIQQVQFHPTLPLMLTAGYDKTLRLFQADGQTNAKLQSVFLEDLPIRRASFIPNSTSVIMTGRRPFYYSYDMASGQSQRVQGCGVDRELSRSLEDMCISPSGNTPMMAFLAKDGYVILVDSRTRRHAAVLKMNGSVRAASFSYDGSELVTGGDEGCLYFWDMRTHRCSMKMEDDGALKTSCIGSSSDGKYWATGSDSGIVNIYDAKNKQANQKPVKTIMNLTTAVDNLQFNHDSQILAISSRFKKEALKMVHLQTMTVFQNWPTLKTPLSTVSSIGFSPDSSYFVVGNDRGKALMYNLSDYYVA